VTVVDRYKPLVSWAVEEETKTIEINVVTPLGKVTASPVGRRSVPQFSRVARTFRLVSFGQSSLCSDYVNLMADG